MGDVGPHAIWTERAAHQTTTRLASFGTRFLLLFLAMSHAMHQPQKAMALMILAMLILPGMDAIAKWLSASMSAGQAVWCRFAFQILLLLPLVLRTRATVSFADMWIHAARGTLMVVGTLVFFVSLKHLPIADAIAIFFVEPLLLTLLAALFLHEPVGWRRLIAVVVGLAGALIVIRPNFEASGWPALLPLGAATTFAVYLILTRKLAQHTDPLHMQFFSGAFGTALTTLLIVAGIELGWPLFVTVWPTPFEWTLLFGLGLISTIGHLLVVYAFQRGPAGLLAPFQYTEIIGATLLGLLIFGDFPDALTWTGVAIIVASGLYVFHRERSST